MRRDITRILSILGIAAIADPALSRYQASSKDTACLSSMKLVGVGIRMYTQDYDNRLPPMKPAARFQKALLPYIKNASICVCPVTNVPFVPNPALSAKLVSSVKKPGADILVQDGRPHPNGWKSVLFLDFSAKLVKTNKR